jgi:hypothetical protein
MIKLLFIFSIFRICLSLINNNDNYEFVKSFLEKNINNKILIKKCINTLFSVKNLNQTYNDFIINKKTVNKLISTKEKKYLRGNNGNLIYENFRNKEKKEKNKNFDNIFSYIKKYTNFNFYKTCSFFEKSLDAYSGINKDTIADDSNYKSKTIFSFNMCKNLRGTSPENIHNSCKDSRLKTDTDNIESTSRIMRSNPITNSHTEKYSKDLPNYKNLFYILFF